MQDKSLNETNNLVPNLQKPNTYHVFTLNKKLSRVKIIFSVMQTEQVNIGIMELERDCNLIQTFELDSWLYKRCPTPGPSHKPAPERDLVLGAGGGGGRGVRGAGENSDDLRKILSQSIDLGALPA